jgi:predicted nucleic acid-binding protein
VTPNLDRLAAAIPAETTLVIDASVALAYLSGAEPLSPAATWLFDAAVGTGRNAAILSAVTAAELLVRPFRRGSEALAVAEGFFRFFGSITIAAVTYDVGREAARIRAATGLAMPDALVIATAVVQGVDLVVTNDAAWPASIDGPEGPIGIVRVGSVVAG